MKKYFLPTLIFFIAASVALFNISGFPKMIGDEGIYVSQAYWLSHFGHLGPYTYWYDHFPLGWAQIGLWQLLTGATGFFSSAVLSARVFMGLVLGGTTTLLYLLANKLTNSKILSFTSVFIFIMSSLTLTFGRMVLLDNLAIFWFLLSLLLLINNPKQIKNLALSGLALGLSILTKESLLFFLPPYLYLAYYLNKDNIHSKYALLVSYVTIFFILGFFPLLAILKNEFLPQANQVSLLGTILLQAGRGSEIPFYLEGSHFRQMLSVWLSIDPILLIVGSISTIATLLFGKALTRILSLFTIFFTLFLVRGGQIYDFYLIPLLPLFALNFALFLHNLAPFKKVYFLSFLFTLILGFYVATNSLYPWTSQATSAQKEAIDTLIDLGPKAVIAAPDYTFLDVYLSDPSTSISWYRKVESDPAVRFSVGKVTNILTDNQFDNELTGGELPYLKSLIQNNKPAAKFGSLLSPGEITRPYTQEFLNLYNLEAQNNTVETIISLQTIDSNSLSSYQADPPHAILVNKENFSSSLDLQNKLLLIKTILPTTEILVSQDSEGHNTIPWISTNARSFFKSKNEAIDATLRKTEALKGLGFTSVIVATTKNDDGYLDSILTATKSHLIPYLFYTGTIPEFAENVIVSTESDLETLKKSNFAGNIYLTD
jgi:hypothetical protein